MILMTDEDWRLETAGRGGRFPVGSRFRLRRKTPTFIPFVGQAKWRGTILPAGTLVERLNGVYERSKVRSGQSGIMGKEYYIPIKLVQSHEHRIFFIAATTLVEASGD